MIPRYNPHSIEKQARQWPVFAHEENLLQDLALRCRQIWKSSKLEFSDFFAVQLPVQSDFKEEYGFDCCRIACLEAQQQKVNLNLFDSSFNWISRLFAKLQQPSTRKFNARLWLEMALQAKDHILVRKKFHAGLVCLKKAVKHAPPKANMSKEEWQLVLGTIYPFAPLLACWFARKNAGMQNIPATVKSLTTLQPVRFCLKNGGWHWAVFDRQEFADNAKKCFLAIKWLKQACQNRSFVLHNTAEGVVICMK